MAAAVAVTSISMAATVVSVHLLPGTRPAAASCSIPQRRSSFSISFKIVRDSGMFSRVLVKASSSDENSLDFNEIFKDLKEKWNAVENKFAITLYGGSAIVAIWLAFVLVSTVDSIPLFPKIMELVGFGYTAWFVYRYLLFKSSRNELAVEIEEIMKKITGTG